MQKKAIPTL